MNTVRLFRILSVFLKPKIVWGVVAMAASLVLGVQTLKCYRQYVAVSLLNTFEPWSNSTTPTTVCVMSGPAYEYRDPG
jgi:hypothetical protein